MSDLKYYTEEQLLDELKSRLATKRDDDIPKVLPVVYWNPTLSAAHTYLTAIRDGKSTEGMAANIFDTVMTSIYGPTVMKWLAKRGLSLPVSYPTVGGTR